MALVISGAGGFTGEHLMRATAARGVAAQALACDLTDWAAVSEEVARLAPERFLHLAGISHAAHSDPRALYQVNLLGTINVLEALAALPEPPTLVVLASSATIYGNCTHSRIGESTPASPVSHYAVSKLAMEQAARAYGDRLPIVIARPFNYTGQGQSTTFVVAKLVDHFRRRAPTIRLGMLNVEREFNDVRFVCDAYLGLLQHGVAGETYNICSGNPVTLHTLLDTLVRLTGHVPQVEIDPALVRPNEVHSLCGDPDRLSEALGPLNMPSLEETLKWMLSEGPQEPSSQ